jgi:hypothetical protein
MVGVDVVVEDVDVVVEDADVVVVGRDVDDVEVEISKVTGMDCGVFVAPTPATMMVVEYVPAASPEIFAVAVNEAGALPDEVPERGESVSHVALVLTLQSNGPFPELEMLTLCTGLDSP